MSAEDYSAADHLPHGGNRFPQAGAVARGCSWRRRSEWLVLPECHIAAQHRESGRAERVGDSYEQRRCAITSGAVSQDEAAFTSDLRLMQKSADRAFMKRGHSRIINYVPQH